MRRKLAAALAATIVAVAFAAPAVAGHHQQKSARSGSGIVAAKF